MNKKEYNREYQKKQYKTERHQKNRAKWLLANPTYYKEYGKVYRLLIKEQTLTHYGNGKLACVRCGFEDIRALSIDHIDGGGTKHCKRLNRFGTSFYKWLIDGDYPKGYQTLCFNCNIIKRSINKEYRFKPDNIRLDALLTR